MKSFKIFSILSLFVVTALFTSCGDDDSSVTPSEITYLPKITLNGESFMMLDCTTETFNDPGAEATEGGQSVPVTVTVIAKYFGSSQVDGVDEYIINYSAVNKDGIPGAAMRRVIWPECSSDNPENIGGTYAADCVRNGVVDPSNFGLENIYIKSLGNDQFQISDAIGGYYDLGRGYGEAYASLGLVVESTGGGNYNVVTQPNGVGAFGGNLVVSDFKKDPSSGNVTWKADWDLGYVFEVTLKLL